MAKQKAPKFRMDAADKARYEARAEAHGWGLSEWVRRALEFCERAEADGIINLKTGQYDLGTMRTARALETLIRDASQKKVDGAEK